MLLDCHFVFPFVCLCVCVALLRTVRMINIFYIFYFGWKRKWKHSGDWVFHGRKVGVSR